uniref:Uncharacterized protein n=1 Tax=Ackermannviridae sp. ctkHJ36 TaxID=2825754 RepID=A0A8S5UKH1_9CAUD|nr:MAG TPA: hypothetical protein [Ackermannviridae sp. ctkHJ36]
MVLKKKFFYHSQPLLFSGPDRRHCSLFSRAL